MSEANQLVETATPTPAAPAPTLLDEYELGDTEAAPMSVPVAEQAAESEPPPVSQRERGPDGRFLTQEPAALATPQHPSYLVRQAGDFGITTEELAEMSTEELGRTVATLTRQVLADRKRPDEVRSIGGEELAPQPAAPAPVADEEYDLGIDTTEYDPVLLGAIKKQFSKQTREIEALKAQLAEQGQRERIRENMSIAERADRQFAKHRSFLGEGRGIEMEPDSPEYLRRLSVLSLVQKDRGRASLESKIDKAVKVLFGAGTAPSRAEEPAPVREDRLAEYRNGALARPTQRAGAPEPNGREKAIKAVAEQRREMGQAEGPGESLDDFLG